MRSALWENLACFVIFKQIIFTLVEPRGDYGFDNGF